MKIEKIKNKDGQIIKVRSVDYEPSLTQQNFKDQTDINLIMERYEKTGQLEHVTKSKGVFADVSNIGDYQESLNRVLAAQQSFGELNAQTRNRFGNDPQQLIDFLSDASNEEEAIKLGLIIPKEKPEKVPKEEPKK